MQIAIIAEDENKSRKFLTKLIGEMKFKDVKYFTDHKSAGCFATLTNGDRYYVAKHILDFRSSRFNEIYCSTKMIDMELYEWLMIGYMNDITPLIEPKIIDIIKFWDEDKLRFLESGKSKPYFNKNQDDLKNWSNNYQI